MPLKLADTVYGAIPVHHFPFGEQRSSSIAAASIVAKVHRDALMSRLEIVFPHTLLGQHKGYSTPAHKKIIIEEKRRLIIHRQTYLKTIYANYENDYENQERIC